MAKTLQLRQNKFDFQPDKFDFQPDKFDFQPDPEAALLNDPNDVSLYERQPAPKKSREQVADIYGDFDIWAAPADSQIWKSPGADFVRGFGQGWIRQTQIPALMGKKLPPPTSKAEKIGELGGQMMEVITEFIGLGAVLRGIGLLPKTVPKGALAIEKALHTGILFGTQEATEEVRKATAEAIYDEDFGSRGGVAIAESFALGAILSLAGSGVGKVWQKLKPTEQGRALKTLGLKKGAGLQEINKAARIQARRFHPDKVKGMREQFDKVISARDALRKANAKDIIIANAKQNFKKQLMAKVGVSEDVADIAIQRINSGESIEKVDQMLSQAKLGIKPPIEQAMTAAEMRVEKDVTEIDEQAERHLKAIREEGVPTETAETPATRGQQAPDIAPERLLPAEVAEISQIPAKAEPEATKLERFGIKQLQKSKSLKNITDAEALNIIRSTDKEEAIKDILRNRGVDVDKVDIPQYDIRGALTGAEEARPTIKGRKPSHQEAINLAVDEAMQDVTDVIDVQMPEYKKAKPEFVKGFAEKISPDKFRDIDVVMAEKVEPKRVASMTEKYKVGDEALLSKPIAAVPYEDGIEVVEGQHRAAAAKKAGVDVPVVVVANSRAELKGMTGKQIDALAQKMWDEAKPEVAKPKIPHKAESAKITVEADRLALEEVGKEPIGLGVTEEQERAWNKKFNAAGVKHFNRLIREFQAKPEAGEIAAEAIKDKTGKPIVFYHGTTWEFEKFNTKTTGLSQEDPGEWGLGFYFTPSPKHAEEYTNIGEWGQPDYRTGVAGPNIRAAYLAIKKPFIVQHIKNSKDPKGYQILDKATIKRVKAAGIKTGPNAGTIKEPDWDYGTGIHEEGLNFRNKLIKAGYDGVIVKVEGLPTERQDIAQIVAFYPEQVLNAIGAKPELIKPPEIAPTVAATQKTIEELQAEIDSYLKAQESPPTELLAEINAARRGKQKPPTKPEPGVTFKEPPRPEGPNVLMVAEVEKRLDEKAMLSENRKLRPGARRLAKKFVGKTDLKKMTEEELSKFGQVIGKLPEPTYNNKGQRIPPSIPKTTAITKAGEFETEYAEPTFMRIFHAPEYYAEKLGVKSLVEKAEAGKIRFSLEYQHLSNKVDGWIKQIDKLGGTKLSEKAQAKLRNQPTKAVARFREILDTHDEPPDALNPKEKELFNNFRELTRWLLKRENAVREALELEPIQYRKAYVRHVAKGLAKDMMTGRYPFPQGRKFWAEEIIAKKIYNTMEMHRTMTEDLEELFSRDLGFATKSMLWTALKEIHLSQPIRYLEQQLTAKGKDTPVYKTLSPSEKAKWDKVATIPSRTRRWVKDYVNVTIKGQQSQLDQDIEAIVKKTGLNGLLNKLLAPYGRALSHKPVSNFVQEAGRAQILGVLGGPIGGRPRQIMRNKFQVMQSMALYPLYKETWRTYAPIRALRKTTPDLERILDKSLFLKAYTGTEEWPVDIKSKIAKASLRAYQWSAVTNARQAMETAYWGMMPLFNKPKFKHYGWADPQRTYTEKPEFLYPSEEKLMLKEMEFGAAATQHNYTPIGMPEIFRHKTLTPITRLQSWWMNHYFRFTEEAMRRAFTGKPTYSKEGGPVLPWKYRLGWLRYALIAVPILNMMRYQRSYFFGAAPTGVPPFAQFAQGMYNYVVGKGAGSEQQWKAGKKQMTQSGKTFIPGYMSYKDFEAIWSGRKDLESLFFYKKR